MRVFNGVADGHSADVQLMTQRYNWAFAGQAHKYDGGRASWDHWIDSRSDEPAEDAGVMSVLPNGDTLEKGAMINDDGVKEAYEEVWREEPVRPELVPVVDAVVLVRLRDKDLRERDETAAEASATGLSAASSALIQTEQGEQVCGMVIRVGQWCQGFVKIDGGFLAERWHRFQDGPWMLTCQMGDANNDELSLPCSAVFESSLDAAQPKIGQELIFKSQQWKYVEIYECPHNKYRKYTSGLS